MGLLDWLTDGGASSSVFGGMGGVNSPSGVDPNQQPPMPPVQMTGTDALPIAPPQPNPGAMAPPVNPAATDIGGGIPPGGTGAPPVPDPSTTDIGGGMPPGGTGAPPAPPPNPAADGNPAAGFGGASMPPQVPLPQPRPPGAPPPMAMTDTPKTTFTPNQPPGAPPPGPGPPMQIAPQNAPPTAPVMPPGQTALGRALGIRPDQAALNGRQSMAGFGAGLKAIGQGAGLGQGKFAAFAGGAGNAMEGANKEAQTQQKQAIDYLKSAIDAKKAGDDQTYKRDMLQFQIKNAQEKLAVEREKMASDKTAANKNDTPTQLYLSAQRLVQPDRNALNKQLDQMRKDGTDPALLAKTQADGEAAIQAKLQGHYSTLGIHPQDAATLAKQPGNSQQNPVDGKVQGLTPDNIAKKLQPGQWFTNPADGKLIQYKGPPKSDDKKSSATPDKPTNPEPIDPTKPYKTPASAMASADDED